MTRIPVYRDDDRKEPVGHADPEGVRAVVDARLRECLERMKEKAGWYHSRGDSDTSNTIYAVINSIDDVLDRAPREPAQEVARVSFHQFEKEMAQEVPRKDRTPTGHCGDEFRAQPEPSTPAVPMGYREAAADIPAPDALPDSSVLRSATIGGGA